MPHTHPALDYSQITDSIFIGTNQCCQSHFSEELLNKGITADISLEEERMDAPFGVSYYTWIPVKDHTAPTVDQLSFGLATLAKLVSLGIKVYVHCKNGHGRAPTLVAAYLVAREGVSVDEALGRIKKKRPSIHLEQTQIDALLTFFKEFKKD